MERHAKVHLEQPAGLALRFFVCFGVALLLTAALPVYPRRSLTRSQVIGRGGDVISFGFELSTLPGFFAERRYMRPEEYPTATSIANIAIWFSISGSIGLAGARFWSRRRGKPRTP